MSTDVKAVGRLKFDSADDIEDARSSLDDDDDESVAEARAVIDEGTRRSRAVLTLAIVANLSADANVWLQEWLSELAELALEGHVDTWQESFGGGAFVRLHAGGREELIDAPFPPT